MKCMSHVILSPPLPPQGAEINSSLMALKSVVHARANQTDAEHLYRRSKLTMALKNSFRLPHAVRYGSEGQRGASEGHRGTVREQWGTERAVGAVWWLWFGYSLTHSLTQPLTYLLTHSLALPPPAHGSDRHRIAGLQGTDSPNTSFNIQGNQKRN